MLMIAIKPLVITIFLFTFTSMELYYRLLKEEEEYRRKEQETLLAAALSNSSGKLSQLQRIGLALVNLEIVNKRSGYGGRTILDLEDVFSKKNSENRGTEKEKVCPFKPGDVIKIISNQNLHQTKAPKSNDTTSKSNSNGTNYLMGTVERRSGGGDCTLSISVSSSNESEASELSGKISIIKILDNSGEFDKMRGNLRDFERISSDCKSSENSGLIEMIRTAVITETTKTDTKKSESSSINMYLEDITDGIENMITTNTNTTFDVSKRLKTKNYNLEQEQAIEMCTSQDLHHPVSLIHGPPGTGKTATLAEIIKTLIFSSGNKKSCKILVCGPSNISVDNLTERLSVMFDKEGGGKGKDSSSPFMLRLGHPSRMLESAQKCSLDFWMESSDAGKLLADVKEEIDEIVNNKLGKCKGKEERRELYGELKLLRGERRKRERSIAVDLIDSARIILCTLSTAAGKKLSEWQRKKSGNNMMMFDVVVVDEAGQALLPETMIAPIFGKKLILAGDHCQLPPTVMNPDLKKDMEISLFSKLMTAGPCKKVMLKEQYRMNELIMQWSNEKFYKGQLRANPSVAQWKLPHDKSGEDVLIFYDTSGWDFYESVPNKSTSEQLTIAMSEQSKSNEGEAQIAINHCKALLASGVEASEIAIISPYAAQVALLNDLKSEHVTDLKDQKDLEIGSIDGFQGREKDAVIISMVRSNEEGIVGFLSEMRRINVAMTRAKKQLVIIADSSTLSRNSDLKQLIDFLNENATIRFPGE